MSIIKQCAHCGSEFIGLRRTPSPHNLERYCSKSCGYAARCTDLIEGQFGRWTVLRRLLDGRWLCRCVCGNSKPVAAGKLQSGKSQSCGCLLDEQRKIRTLKHGHCRNGKTTPEYQTWSQMINRCTNANWPHYKNYGGRGIKVCKRWINSFENFLADMGLRPVGRSCNGKRSKYSLDRKNNDGNYTPKNCRWATSEEQNNNQRRRSTP